jgi:hypothetical protein
MSHSKLVESWKSFLSEIDVCLQEDVELHCLGGFAATMLYGLARTTADVDVVLITPSGEIKPLLGLAGKGSLLHRKHKVYLDFVTVAVVPEDYDQRLKGMFSSAFKRLRLFALDPYDIALTKLERNTQRDRDDIKHLARTTPFDLEELRTRYARELRPYLGNPEREDLRFRCGSNQSKWIESIEEERGK